MCSVCIGQAREGRKGGREAGGCSRLMKRSRGVRCFSGWHVCLSDTPSRSLCVPLSCCLLLLLQLAEGTFDLLDAGSAVQCSAVRMLRLTRVWQENVVGDTIQSIYLP